jgi:lipid A ethanolaminephosphotransferase
MSSLKLFRSTEFALSSFFSPQRERAALHPAWAIVLVSLWIATVCNIALWRRLAQLPELNSAAGVWFGIGLAVMIAAATSALLCLFAWRWTFKPAVTVFLLAAAIGTYFMLGDGIVIDTPAMLHALQAGPNGVGDLLNWRLLASVLVLAVLPAVWLWRKPLRRVRAGRQLVVNAFVFVASCALLAGATVVFHENLASALRDHTQLRYLVNPLNSFYALADIAAAPTPHETGPRN